MRLLNIVVQDFGDHATVEIKRADGAPEFETLKLPLRGEADRKAMVVGLRAASAAFIYPELRASCIEQLRASFGVVRE